MEDTSNPKKLPRLRKTNFSQLEENILQTEVEKNYATIREKHSTSTTNQEKNKIWTNITNKINALGVANRTQKEVRDKWRNLTTKAKSAFTEHRREINKTGGGPAPKKPSSSVERVVNMLQDSTSFSGIQGGIETSCFECLPAGADVIIHRTATAGQRTDRKEKKQTEKVAIQIQLLKKLNEDNTIPPTLTGSQAAYLAAMSSCFEDS
ncbi:unnamed protein product [Mytilus coruscus]|uniref:Myb-like domain-containing protein n=1 Tax=Mytilus coruscus TaxID=42192 RepID=A0A6J8CSE7_MYTCO|nr:unnamed protein product [Mytilus coruscus]